MEKEETRKPASFKDSFYSFFYDGYDGKIPLIYSDKYNISFLGLEKLHPFDSCKYENVVNQLLERGVIRSKSDLILPKEMPQEAHLLGPLSSRYNPRLALSVAGLTPLEAEIHTAEYLDTLKSSIEVAKITEIPLVAALPSFLVRWRILTPFMYATSGSIIAAHVARALGYAINIGGGFHHCCGSSGGGFCAYADITLCYHFARKHLQGVQRIMIIDLDAHQGNGHERDKLSTQDNDVYILDMFNPHIYPFDEYAATAINKKIHVLTGTQDTEYLAKLSKGLKEAFQEFQPDFIIYNAGTDVLQGDPLGQLGVSPEGVKQRDLMVFETARKKKIPLVMLLSGGYQKSNASIIATSIEDIYAKYPADSI